MGMEPGEYTVQPNQDFFQDWWSTNTRASGRLGEGDVERIAVAVADELERRARPSVLSVSTDDVRRWCPELKP